MTIQEAIKSGRPFRRPGWEDYIICPKDTDKGLEWTNENGKFWPRAEDVIADDYELEPAKPREFWICRFRPNGSLQVALEKPDTAAFLETIHVREII